MTQADHGASTPAVDNTVLPAQGFQSVDDPDTSAIDREQPRIALPHTRQECAAGRPDFSRPVPETGYVWWYVDAVSDDGRHSMTLILFIGSVFSPYYALARRRGRGDPENHVSVNAVLYGASGKRWTMTERGRTALQRDRDHLQIGASTARWAAGCLSVDIDEVGVPLPRRSRGRIVVEPSFIGSHAVSLDRDRRHCWWPIAPCARVRIEFEKPALRWEGEGYLDTNSGDRPLEADFLEWTWSRGSDRDGTTVFYDLTDRTGQQRSHAVHFDARRGQAGSVTAPPLIDLPGTGWRIRRAARSERADPPRVISTLEDTPFYARSLIRQRIGTRELTAVHESLSMTRFVHPVVQCMLPFRMPRRG
jgi:carotenoid 1,2-hydratase